MGRSEKRRMKGKGKEEREDDGRAEGLNGWPRSLPAFVEGHIKEIKNSTNIPRPRENIGHYQRHEN